MVNSPDIQAKKIWVKYFEPGHTYMSADSFHHHVELSMQYKGSVCDFKDFSNAVQNANSGKVTVIEMEIGHFYDWLDHSSQAKIKKNGAATIFVRNNNAVCRAGKNWLQYFTNYDSTTPRILKFLKVKSERDGIQKPVPRTNPRGISKEKKDGIIKKLCPLTTEERRQFWNDIDVADNVSDLNTSFE